MGVNQLGVIEIVEIVEYRLKVYSMFNKITLNANFRRLLGWLLTSTKTPQSYKVKGNGYKNSIATYTLISPLLTLMKLLNS